MLEKRGRAGMADSGEDLWSLHLTGKVAPAAVQRVIPRCPLIPEMSMEPTHAAALLAGGMDHMVYLDNAECICVAPL